MTSDRPDARTNSAAESAAILNAHLASAIDLQGQAKQAHWNVRGANFIALHELFDTIAGEVEDWSDLLAERVRALDAQANGTIQVAASATTLPTYPHGLADGTAHTETLAAALQIFADCTRAAIDRTAAFGDAVTADVLTEISRAADAARWKVASHNGI